MVLIAKRPQNPYPLPLTQTRPEDLPETREGGRTAPFDLTVACYPAGVREMVVMLDQQVERFTGCDDQCRLPGHRPFREPLHRGASPLRSVGDEVRYPGCVHDLEQGLPSSLQLTLREPGEGIGVAGHSLVRARAGGRCGGRSW